MYFGVGVGVAIGLLTLVPVAVTPRGPTTNALALDLPKSGCSGDIQSFVHVNLRADGTTVLDDALVPNDDAVLSLFPRVPETRLLLDVEPSVPHGRVVHVIDLAAQAGIEAIEFGTADRYAARAWIVRP